MIYLSFFFWFILWTFWPFISSEIWDDLIPITSPLIPPPHLQKKVEIKTFFRIAALHWQGKSNYFLGGNSTQLLGLFCKTSLTLLMNKMPIITASTGCEINRYYNFPCMDIFNIHCTYDVIRLYLTVFLVCSVSRCLKAFLMTINVDHFYQAVKAGLNMKYTVI